MIIESTALFMYTIKDLCQLVESVCMLIDCPSCILYPSIQQILLGIYSSFDRIGSKGKRSSCRFNDSEVSCELLAFLTGPCAAKHRRLKP
jgi:hypothetical protein